MEKFDQPELHPRGFPLWVNILLVSALILTPLVVVALYQAWQDKQAAQNAPIAQPVNPAPQSKVETTPEAAGSTDSKEETSSEMKSAPTSENSEKQESKPAN